MYKTLELIPNTSEYINVLTYIQTDIVKIKYIKTKSEYLSSIMFYKRSWPQL